MTRHKIIVLEDGTRVYSNYTRYTPMPDEDRVRQRRKPAQEGAVLWGGTWLLPLPLVPAEARLWPETRPDTDAYEHMSKPRRCKCQVCKRPEAERWKQRWLKAHKAV